MFNSDAFSFVAFGLKKMSYLISVMLERLKGKDFSLALVGYVDVRNLNFAKVCSLVVSD